jgi:hypothetical protein
MKKYKKLENFIPIETISPQDYFPLFSHVLSIFRKRDKNSYWFIKCLAKENYKGNYEAIEEVVAQELFRLILPSHPKTRWIKDKRIRPDGSRVSDYYVASKAIPGVDTLFFYDNPVCYQAILNGEIRGLGGIQVVSLWLNETDFKAGNVVCVENGEIVKLDGGLCFTEGKPEFESLWAGKNFTITSNDLKELPLLTDYDAHNWLGWFSWDDYNTKTKIKTKNLTSLLAQAAPHISAYPPYKEEINQALLRIMLLPETLIRYFVNCYVPNSDRMDGEELVRVILDRQTQLVQAAHKIESFVTYQASDKVQKDILEYVNYLKSFKTMGKSVLLTDIKENCKYDVENYIHERFIKGYFPIKNFFSMLDSSKYQDQVHGLINKLKEIIGEYIKSPTSEKHQALRGTLYDVKNDLKKLNFPEDDWLILSINKLIKQLDAFAKGAPIPPPRKINNIHIWRNNKPHSHTLARKHIVTITEAMAPAVLKKAAPIPSPRKGKDSLSGNNPHYLFSPAKIVSTSPENNSFSYLEFNKVWV